MRAIEIRILVQGCDRYDVNPICLAVLSVIIHYDLRIAVFPAHSTVSSLLPLARHSTRSTVCINSVSFPHSPSLPSSAPSSTPLELPLLDTIHKSLLHSYFFALPPPQPFPVFFFFNEAAPPEIYPFPLHDAFPI